MKQLIRHDILVMALIFGAISIFGVNCTKDTTNAQKDGSTGLVSSCGEKLDASNVLGLIRNDHDAVDDKITLICYHYAQAIRQLAKNQTHLCYMVNAMLAADDTGVSLADLAQGNSTFAQALNAQLRSSVNTNTSIYPKGTEQPESDIETVSASSTWDANSYLKSKMIYSPFNYHPTIYFIKKPASCVQEKPVSVMIAQDVDDCDDVAGWTGDDEAIMSEGEVKSTSDIVIFVGPNRRSTSSIAGGFDNPDDNIQLSPEQEGSVIASERAAGDVNLVTRQIMAGFRFERSNKSELAGNILNYIPGSTAFDVIFPSPYNMLKFHKDDINASTTFTDVKTAYFNVLPATSSRMMVVFYEHDWWASVEVINNACDSPNFVRARMKYAHEFYANNCLLTSSAWPIVGSTVTISNNKCMFVLTRVP